MNKFQYISSNLDRFKREVKMGIISVSVFAHWAIYSRYDYYRKLGNSVTNSVLFASETMCVSERCVYKVIKEMEVTV